jgi:peroxiredoxin Q/BCP
VLAIGERAPEFELPDAGGKVIRSSDLRGRPLVVYFYPKDQTPGCTIEACSFRDEYKSFTDIGADVVGISSDDAASHARFAERHRLPFRLLSDREGATRRAFGVPNTLGILPGRATFVLDGDGIVRYAFNSQFMLTAHVSKALEVVRKLQADAVR